MLSNKWANRINQTLAVIKLITYSIIAIAGLVKLGTSRVNWQNTLSGNSDITAYSSAILLVNTNVFFDKIFYRNMLKKFFFILIIGHVQL